MLDKRISNQDFPMTLWPWNQLHQYQTLEFSDDIIPNEERHGILYVWIWTKVKVTEMWYKMVQIDSVCNHGVYDFWWKCS